MTASDNQLKIAGITPTPVRILVFRCLQQATGPLSLSDLENNLESVDKSTISRTLNIFKDHHLIHSFNDGSGSTKYELCHSSRGDGHDDLHVHFRCERCGQTICLQDIVIPEISLPEGFISHDVSYLVKGICKNCGLKN